MFASGLVATVVASWRGGGVPERSVPAASETGVMRAELLPTMTLERNGEAVPDARPVRGPDTGARAVRLPRPVARRSWSRLPTGTRPLMDTTWVGTVLDIVCAAYASAAVGGADGRGSLHRPPGPHAAAALGGGAP